MLIITKDEYSMSEQNGIRSGSNNNNSSNTHDDDDDGIEYENEFDEIEYYEYEPVDGTTARRSRRRRRSQREVSARNGGGALNSSSIWNGYHPRSNDDEDDDDDNARRRRRRRRTAGDLTASYEASVRRQEAFVSTMERISGDADPDEGGLLRRVASELNWTVEEAERCALRYFVALCEADRDGSRHPQQQRRRPQVEVSNGGSIATRNNHGFRNSSNGIVRRPNPSNGNLVVGADGDNGSRRSGWGSRPWTDDENVLFEVLLARYYSPSAEATSREHPAAENAALRWEDLVALHLPGRTAPEIRARTVQLEEEERRRLQQQQQQQQHEQN